MRNERPCPICSSKEYELFATETIDQNRITEFSYASRKTPEFMRHRLVRCLNCDLVYAPAPPVQEELSKAYGEAGYDSAVEATYAAQTYINYLKPQITKLADKKLAVDVGAGNGALLPLLLQQGFQDVIGIEPSRAAIMTAPEEIRHMLHEEIFTTKSLAGQQPSLICSFMTLEHIPNPAELVHVAAKTLPSGGILALVVHNWQGTLNKLLGLHSPIIDIEHLQLYCPKAITTLLENAGFSAIHLQSIRNQYPLPYWLSLLPLPVSAKTAILNLLHKTKLQQTTMSFNVGNLFVSGIKR